MTTEDLIALLRPKLGDKDKVKLESFGNFFQAEVLLEGPNPAEDGKEHLTPASAPQKHRRLRVKGPVIKPQPVDALYTGNPSSSYSPTDNFDLASYNANSAASRTSRAQRTGASPPPKRGIVHSAGKIKTSSSHFACPPGSVKAKVAMRNAMKEDAVARPPTGISNRNRHRKAGAGTPGENVISNMFIRRNVATSTPEGTLTTKSVRCAVCANTTKSTCSLLMDIIFSPTSHSKVSRGRAPLGAGTTTKTTGVLSMGLSTR
jgi:hypothetical protein